MPGPRVLADLFGGFGNNQAPVSDTEEEKLRSLPEGPDKELAMASRAVPEQAPAAMPDWESQPYPGTPGSAEAGYSDAEGTSLENDLLNRTANFLPNPRSAGAAILPEGENYHPYGGKEGYDRFHKTFDEQPQDIYRSLQEGGQAQEEQGKATADFYQSEQARQAKENAVLQERRQQRQQEIQAKQQEVELATQRYTADLADKGQFWRNPGNIVAAIGAALMGLGSDDHTIGLKIVNQAIQSDWNQRKQLADSHMGELKSNLAAYRQIAGDADLGDRLSQSENYRQAANELQRIGATFQGKIAKAKTQAIAQEFLMKAEQLRAQTYAAMLYNKPRVENPAIVGAYKASGKADPQSGWRALSGSQGAPNWQPGASNGQYQGGVQGQAALGPSREDQEAVDNAFTARLEKRAPGVSAEINTIRDRVYRHVLAQAKADPSLYRTGMTESQLASQLTPQQRSVFNEKMAAFHDAQAEDLSKVSAMIAPKAEKNASYMQLGQQLDIIQNTANALKMTPDQLIDSKWEQVIGAGNVKKLQDLWRSDGDQGKYDRQRKALQDAVNTFRQSRAQGVASYFKAVSGAAISDKERELLDQVVHAGSKFDAVRSFHKMFSGQAQNEANASVNGVKNPLTKAIWKIRMGNSTPQQDRQAIASGYAGPEKQNSSVARSPSEKRPYQGEDTDLARGSAWLKSQGFKIPEETKKKAIQKLKGR